MVTKTYLPSNLCHGSDSKDSSDTCNSSDISESSDSSEISDSSDNFFLMIKKKKITTKKFHKKNQKLKL